MKKYAAAINPNGNISPRGNLLLFSGVSRSHLETMVYEVARRIRGELALVEQDSQYLVDHAMVY